MNQTYKPRLSIISPFQRMRQKTDDAFNVRDNKQHPVRAEIEKSVGTFNLTVTISQDLETLALFKNVKGLIAFRCDLKRGDDIIGVGRGASVLSRASKYVEKSVAMAANASLTDAIAKATRIIDSLRIGAESTIADKALGEAYRAQESNAYDSATPKQVEYLKQLIAVSVFDDEERNRWEDQISSFSRSDASEAIQTLTRDR